MERLNINILGISELKWTRMGEFNSDDHFIHIHIHTHTHTHTHYCGQESL